MHLVLGRQPAPLKDRCEPARARRARLQYAGALAFESKRLWPAFSARFEAAAIVA